MCPWGRPCRNSAEGASGDTAVQRPQEDGTEKLVDRKHLLGPPPPSVLPLLLPQASEDLGSPWPQFLFPVSLAPTLPSCAAGLSLFLPSWCRPSGVCSWDGPVYLFPASVSGPTVCGVRLAVRQQVVTERALRQEDADVASEQGSISRQRVAVRSVCRDRGWWSSGCGRGVFPGSVLLRLCGCGGW